MGVLKQATDIHYQKDLNKVRKNMTKLIAEIGLESYGRYEDKVLI